MDGMDGQIIFHFHDAEVHLSNLSMDRKRPLSNSKMEAKKVLLSP